MQHFCKKKTTLYMEATVTFLKWNPEGDKNSQGPCVDNISQDVFMETAGPVHKKAGGMCTEGTCGWSEECSIQK